MTQQTAHSATAAPATLPQWLQQQAHQRAGGVALRHKHLGVWQQRSWLQAAHEVQQVASALQDRGFAMGATLAVVSRPRPEALLVALAAQWLGGVAVLLNPLDAAAEQIALLRRLQPEAIFAEGLPELERLRVGQLTPALVLYADGRGVAGQQNQHPTASTWVDYAQLAAPRQGDAVSVLPIQARAERTAFAFYRYGTSGGIEEQRITHAELLQEGQRLVQTEQLGADEEALAARAFAAGGQARYLLAPWLITGFRLNFPENLGTRDNDRRELGPTLVAGTRETYGRLYELVQSRLPLPGSAQRRLVDWALTAQPGLTRRWLGEWLVRRPLRDVLGFSRTRAPLLVGEPLPEPTRAFFAALGIQVRAWPDPAQWLNPAALPVAPHAPAPATTDWHHPGAQTA